MTTLTGIPVTNAPAPGSPEWLRCMSASKVSSAIGMVGSFESPLSLWSKMTGRTPSLPISQDRVTYGRYLETALLNWVADNHPDQDMRPGITYRHPGNERYTAAPDGELHAADGTVTLVECKTAMDTTQWGQEGTSEIPPKYLVQCAWQMHITGARTVLVPADVGMTFRLYIVHWADVADDFPAVLAGVEHFLHLVDTDTAPDWDGADTTYQAVRYWHPEIDGEDVEVTVEQAQELAAAIRDKKTAEAHERRLKTELLAHMGTARRAVTPGGMAVATRQSRNGGPPSLITARGLANAAPEPTALAA